MRGRWGAAALAAVAVVAASVHGRAHAELLEVRQVAAGMECPECARGLRLVVKGIAGVDDAETSWNRRVLTVRFHPGSGATLAQVRAAVLHQHFDPREAEIIVAGRLTLAPPTPPTAAPRLVAGAPRLGLLRLRVPESGLTYRIDLIGREEEWWRVLGGMLGAQVIVTGRVPSGEHAKDPLVLYPVDIQVVRSHESR